ncbi:hypothetical protein OIDMADRAFT_136312 [Oidiodendron maius Zn]|uniref:Methyltransferase domain-containing protein n=1 Tax=Oidiodendron maius (strain Zn) TaxID=913774 RepID=A0A0C3GSY0_OIDMZ|nr:hypothetical protein OIDMADRAFT_136312 [Oidiodendron maius Zn]
MVPATEHGTASDNSSTELSPNVPPSATAAVPGISQVGQAATEAADEPTAPSPVHAPSPPESIIEADDLVSLSNSQVSVTSSVFEFVHEHGHRYHRKPEALLPNDEFEQDRLDLQHHIFRMLLDGGLTHTVLLDDKPLEIIDIGCGTGIWAIEMGDDFPNASIRGIDESPIQPPWVPPNVTFEIDDVTKTWLVKGSSIDFVHIRTMAGCIPSWPDLLRSALSALKPGGHIEVADIMWHFECQDGSMKPDCASIQWADKFHELATASFHVDFAPSPKMAGWLEEVGFVDINVHTRLVPVGPWPKDKKLKEIGRYFLAQMLQGGMENYSMALFTKAGWTDIGVHAMLGDVRQEITDPRVHSFTRAWFITGRKAEEGGDHSLP